MDFIWFIKGWLIDIGFIKGWLIDMIQQKNNSVASYLLIQKRTLIGLIGSWYGYPWRNLHRSKFLQLEFLQKLKFWWMVLFQINFAWGVQLDKNIPFHHLFSTKLERDKIWACKLWHIMLKDKNSIIQQDFSKNQVQNLFIQYWTPLAKYGNQAF